MSLKEAAISNGAYTTRDVVWKLPNNLVDAAPKPGDLIVAEKEPKIKWTALDVSYSPLHKTYKLTCRALAIEYDLRDTATIWGPLNRQDAAAGRMPTFVPGASTAARFQEEAGETTMERGGLRQKRRYKIYLEDEVTVGPEDQIRDQDGGIYDYVSHEAPDRIDSLMVVTAERRP